MYREKAETRRGWIKRQKEGGREREALMTEFEDLDPAIFENLKNSLLSCLNKLELGFYKLHYKKTPVKESMFPVYLY